MAKKSVSTNSTFKPAWWLRNKHLQTMWTRVSRRKLKVAIKKRRYELPDGDFLDTAWAGEGAHNPIVIILHGLGGSLRSPYAAGIMNSIVAHGWRAVFMYFRGASEEPNRLMRSYHSGDTGDFNFLVNEIRKANPGIPIFAVGFSLGGNVLLKWLGENKEKANVKAAVAVSVPFDLPLAANSLQKGFSRVYQWYLLTVLKRKYTAKFAPEKAPISHKQVKACRNFWTFDNTVTAPLHGFYDVHDYYRQCSSKHFIKDIRLPTLIIHAEDDPFMTTEVIPEHFHASSSVEFDISPNGGHVGFISGQIPGLAEYWLDQRILSFFSGKMN